MTDAIDLSTVTILNSPDVRSWPITSEITRLALGGAAIAIDHTKRGQWPAVPFESTTQEATIWVFFKIGGVWYATGGERLRPNQSEKSLDAPSHIGPGWLYAPDRWKQMANYVPQAGELVGFMVTAGDERNLGGNITVRERTAVVLIPFPSDAAGGSYPPFAGGTAPGPVVPPPVVQPPAGGDPSSVAARLDRIEAALAALAARKDPVYTGTVGTTTITLRPSREP